MNIRDELKKEVEKLNSYNIEDAILKVQMLLQHALGVSHEYLAIHYEDKLENDVIKKFEQSVVDLINGKPIQYITNNQSFYGYDFYVDENVLIPQPDTECLVEEVIQISKNYDRKIKILDMCTGSGAISVSLRKNINATVFASDISIDVLEIARKNAVINNAEVSFIESDMFTKIEEKNFDIIVSNPPYIETDVIKKLPDEVKKEPKIALDGGIDGLDFYRILAQQSKEYLNENGILALEIGFNQKEAVMELLKTQGFEDVYSKKDFGGNDRIVIGKWRK